MLYAPPTCTPFRRWNASPDEEGTETERMNRVQKRTEIVGTRAPMKRGLKHGADSLLVGRDEGRWNASPDEEGTETETTLAMDRARGSWNASPDEEGTETG